MTYLANSKTGDQLTVDDVGDQEVAAELNRTAVANQLRDAKTPAPARIGG